MDRNPLGAVPPLHYTLVALLRDEASVVNRAGHLTCGRTDLRIVGYGDDHRWEVRCAGCGLSERWTQDEWRTATREPISSGLITVSADDN